MKASELKSVGDASCCPGCLYDVPGRVDQGRGWLSVVGSVGG